MLQRSLATYLASAVFLLSPARLRADGGPADFYLKSGDTVVMYGDSITQQALYTQFIELYTVTRFPGMRVHFFGSGVGGDKVSGGGGGTVDERLARDVFPYKPTVVTVMLGMNDAAYQPGTEALRSAYTVGYEHLLESVRSHAPGVRLTLLGPSAFDDVTRPPQFPGGYNGVLRGYADLDRELARKFNGSFINLNPPVVALLEKAEGLDPLTARLLVPDRIHPDTIAHWVMAQAVLKGWNAPALVSSVTIDAHAAMAAETTNASVDGVEETKEGLGWTETESALPLPFNEKNAIHGLLLQLTDIEQQLNEEPLRITGLDAGEYRLTIDDRSIGTFSAAELGAGINLARYSTPMRDQAQQVAWIVADRDAARTVQIRMLIGKADTGATEGKPDLLDAFQASEETRIYEAATPKPHRYRVVRVNAGVAEIVP
jgi:lysophospholipase L1-like esterase